MSHQKGCFIFPFKVPLGVLKRAIFLRRFFYFSLLSLTFLLFGCSKVRLTNQTFVVELGRDVYANPDIYLQNPEDFETDELSVKTQSPQVVLVNNRFVSTGLEYLNVGEYNFVIKEKNHTIPFVIKVKDTQPPSIQNSLGVIEVNWGAEIDWQSIYEASDLSGVYYDAPTGFTSNPGEYEIDVKIRDRFGNATTRHIHVIVKGG